MKRFLSENLSIIVKFILTHIVMSVLGIMVGLAIISIESGSGFSPLVIISSVFTIGFLCFMHYDDMYFYSVKEGIRLRADGKKIDVFKGLKITLVAYSPVILIGLITIILHLVNNTSDASAISLLAYYAFQGSFLTLYRISNYVGIVGYIIISLIPAILFSALGYALGVKDKTLRGLFGIKVKPPYDGPIERNRKDKK